MADDPTYDLEASFTVDLIVDREAGEKYAQEGGSAEGGAGGAASEGGAEGKWSGKVDLEGNLTSIKGVAEAINKALSGQTFALKFSFGDLQGDIYEAIGSDPFLITLQVANLDELKDLKVGVRSDTGEAGAGASTAITPTPALARTLGANPNLGTAITGLYTVLTERNFAARGMGSTPEQLNEVLRVLGTDLDKIKTQGGAIDTLLADQGDAKEAGPPLRAAAGQFIHEAQRSSEGGSTPLSALIREGNLFAAAPASTTTTSTSTRPTAAEVQRATNLAAAVMPALATATSEAAVTPIVEKATEVTEQPTAGAAAPDVRSAASARGLGGVMTLDELVDQTNLRLKLLPEGRRETDPHARRNPFDVDPNTGDRLTAQQVVDRNRGLIPTAVSPTTGHSYSQIERGAALGVFSQLAEILDERGKRTGRYQRFDVSDTENPAVQALLRGKPAMIEGVMARGLKESEAATIIARGAATRGGGGIVPPEDLQAAPGENPDRDPFALRVFQKLVPKQAAKFMAGFRHIDRPQMMRSAERSPEEYAKADLEYVAAWEQLGQLEDEMAGRSLSTRQKKEYEDRINRTRSKMDRLVSEGGADPGSIVVARMPPLQRIEALRERRESQIEQNFENQQNVADRVGISPHTLADERFKAAETERNDRSAKVVQSKLETLRNQVSTGMLPVSRETLPAGYEVPEDQMLTTGRFLKEHIASILDEFRESIGQKRTGTVKAPTGYGEVLSPYIKAAFEPARDSISGMAIEKGGPFGTPVRDPHGRYGSPRGVSWTEQGITAAEARASMVREPEKMLTTDVDRRLSQLQHVTERPGWDPTKIHWRPAVGATKGPDTRRADDIEKAARQEALLKTVQDRGLFPASGPEGPTEDDYAELDRHIKSLKKAAAPTITKRTSPESRKEILEARDALKEFERITGDRAAGTKGAPDYEANYQAAKDSLEVSVPKYDTTSEEQEAAKLFQLRRVAQRLIMRESGQRVIARDFRRAGVGDLNERMFPGRNIGDVLPGEYRYSEPTRTGAETAERIRGLQNVPDALRTEALQQIEGGVAPGLTRRDVEKRRRQAEFAATGVPEGGGTLTGDETRAAAAQTRFVAGEVAAGAAAGGGGAGKPPEHTGLASGPPPGDRESRYDGLGSGPIHVIIDGQPIRVTLAGMSQGPQDSPFGQDALSRTRYLAARQAFRDASMPIETAEDVASGQMGMFDEPKKRKHMGRAWKLYQQARDEGLDDEATYKVLSGAGLKTSADIIMAKMGITGGGAGIGRTGGFGLQDANSLRRRFGIEPLQAGDEGYFSSIDEADTRRSELAALARRAERGIPKRGFTASVTDIFSNLGGFLDEQVAAVQRYQYEGTELSSMLRKTPRLEREAARREQERAGIEGTVEELKAVKENAGELGLSDKETKKFTAAINELSGVLDRAAARAQKAAQALEEHNEGLQFQEKRTLEAQEGLPTGSQRLAAFAIGGVAAGGAFAVGNMIAQVTSQIMQLVVSTAQAAIGPVMEREVFGFSQTAARIENQYAGSVRQSGGLTGAVYGEMGRSGIAAGNLQTMAPLLADRAATMAGNQALGEALDNLHAFESIRRDREGLGGYDANLVAGRGGLFNGFLGGTASTFEMVKNELRNAPQLDTQAISGMSSSMLGWGAQARPGEGASASQLAAAPWAAQAESMARGRLETALANTDDNINVASTRLDFFNKQAEKGGVTDVALSATAGEAANTQSVAAAERAGLFELAQRLKDTGNSFTGLSSNVDEAAQQILDWGMAVNRSTRTMTPEAFVKETEQAMVLQLERQSLNLALGLRAGSTQYGMGQLLAPQAGIVRQQGEGEYQPTGPFVNPYAPLEALSTRGMTVKPDQELIKLTDEYRQATKESRQDAIDYVTNGVQLPGMDNPLQGLGPEAGAAFAMHLDKAAGYANRIAEIRLDVQTEQAAYQAHQFANSIYIANRSLADAKALAGGVGSEFGKIQRQQWELGRESQALSMALTQRQINFRIATAGLTQPGMTPEMRAASIKQAQLEAKYAQEQLDIQKELFKLAGRGFQITADRSVRDLGRSLALLREGWKLTVHSAEAEEKIKTLTGLQAKENQKVQQFFDGATTRMTSLLDYAQQMADATKTSMMSATNTAIDAFSRYYKVVIKNINDYHARIQDLYNDAFGIGVNTGHAGNSGPTQFGASGLLGNVDSATHMVVGEAGPETVAVLRNPRNVPVGGGGGGGVFNPQAAPIVNINFNNPVVKKEEDLRKIAREIERILGQRATLLYGRNI